MNIIIPLGGIGKRFSDYGYIKPKPLIKVLGKEIIFWLIDSLKINEDDCVYIPYNEFLESYSFEEIINSRYPQIKTLSIPPTNGPSETLKICLNHFEIKNEIILLDGDTWYNEDILEKIRNKKTNLTTYFKTNSPNPIYSYLDLIDDRIITIKEKIKISNYANTGCYVFSDAKEVLRYINQIDKKSEVYISDIITEMLKDNIPFHGIEVTDFHILGTPQQIIEFSKSYTTDKKRFVFDLDNTLVTYPVIPDDYTSVKPISKTINYLRNLKKQGHQIIIYTARRMRTHKGNVGKIVADIGKITIDTLNKFEIPYDELYFGKPYGHFYIDDLMINPKSDLNKELGFYMESVEPRHFNKLIFDLKTVTKISDDKKLEGEAYYYKEIEKYPVKKYFPKLHSYNSGSIVIDRIDGTNFTTLYINEILTTTHLDKLFSTINEIHSSGESIKREFVKYYDYTDKILNRYNSFNYDIIGLKEEERTQILNSVKDIQGEYTPIHGDLVFSNVLLTNDGQIKLIDVKGILGDELTIYGHYLYDYGKIYQSLIGYDEILLNKKISNSYKRKMLLHFESKFTNTEILSTIKKITKSLLVTLIPLHNEPEKFKDYVKLIKEL